MLGVCWIEGDGPAATRAHGSPAVFYDAVGDLSLARLGPYATEKEAVDDLNARIAAGKPVPSPRVIKQETGQWWVVNTKYGPSISHCQIRGLRDPMAWGVADRWRVAEKLRDPAYASQAAFALFKAYGLGIWSAYKHDTYLPHVGKDYVLVAGHPRAALWNS